MAEVDGEVDLVGLRDFELTSLVLHEHSHELIANLWSVLGVVEQTELLCLHVVLELRVVLQLDVL